ncbi:MAG: helix-turn-helix domain-containing protein [Candidatus Methanoplasma sp.]|jgi:transcriptional regulator with XRE-family HTH domain|nr:helix-turn-helix domain-containing protein [Candidatus Methanoplasma sp.]
MYFPSDVYELSDTEIIKLIGEKVRTIRLNSNVTREQLQEVSGVHAKTIGDLESGRNVTVATLISVLRGLRKLNLLDRLLEEEAVSPLLLFKAKGNPPVRATGRSSEARKKRMNI